MTEKRYTIKPSTIIDDVTVIIDNQKEYTFPVLDSTLNYMFCKVLNEQHEDLKHELTVSKALRDVVRELLKENEQLKQTVSDWSGSYDELFEDVKRLEEENEQLRTKNNAYIQDIEVFKEENTHLKLENERLKSELKAIREERDKEFAIGNGW